MQVLVYNTTSGNIDKKQRKCKIIWFNPPYPVNIKTNIGKILLNLLLLSLLKLLKIFDKNNIKITNRCMNNISPIIAGHNKLLLQITEYVYNYKVRNTCPLQNQ